MFKSLWLWVIGSVVGFFAVMRSLAFRSVRINKEMATALFEQVQRDGRTFILHEEITSHKLPTIYDALCWLGGVMPFRLRIEERMLRAGFTGTDSVTTVTALRWKIGKILAGIDTRSKDDTVGVYLLKPWDATRIGKLKIPDILTRPLIDRDVYCALEEDVAMVSAGAITRTGVLLYGPPGNGKSHPSRYLALKYRLPIYIVSFRPDQNNHDVIKMFSYLKGPCVVVMEDFDGYFHGRECQLNEAQFTFDAVLNVLDGTYAALDGVILVMTVNDISKVDDALKRRPGRLRHVIEIPNPPESVRERVFEGRDTVGLALADDASLDELLAVRDTLPTTVRCNKSQDNVRRDCRTGEHS